MAAIKIDFHVSFRVIVPMLQHRHFQNIKTDGNEFKMFYKKNVIYWLIHNDFQIQEIFPERVANLINKLVLHTRLFIGFATLSGNISCIWKSMWINLYIQEIWTYGSGTQCVVQCWLRFIWSLWKYLEKFSSYKADRTVSAVVQAWDLIILKPAPPVFMFWNWETKFQLFDAFDRGFVTADKLYELGQLLNVVHGDIEFSNVHSNKTSQRLEIIARWGPLPISRERGGSVVECRTPEREVLGSRPTAAVLCPWARHFTPRKYWLITQEAMAPSRYDWKIVDWDVKPQHNQPNSQSVWSSGLKVVSNRRCWVWHGHQKSWTILVCRTSKS